MKNIHIDEIKYILYKVSKKIIRRGAAFSGSAFLRAFLKRQRGILVNCTDAQVRFQGSDNSSTLY